MKAVFGIFALFLVAANAGVIEEPINYEGLINGIITDSKQAAIDTVHILEHQFEEIVIDPLHEISEALDTIEARKEEDEACVVAQEAHIQAAVSEMHNEMGHCGAVAAKSSADIAIDVTKSAQQLVFDGLDVYQGYQKCNGYKNKVLRNSCFATLSIKATRYTVNARRSIKTIKAAPARVPAVFDEADTCTHVASEKAVKELEVVHRDIDACAHKY